MKKYYNDPETPEFDENESIEGKLGFEKNLFIQIRACMDNLSEGNNQAWNSVNTLCDSMVFYQDKDFQGRLDQIDDEFEKAHGKIESSVKGTHAKQSLRLNAAAKKFRLIMRLLGEKGVLLKKTAGVDI